MLRTLPRFVRPQCLSLCMSWVLFLYLISLVGLYSPYCKSRLSDIPHDILTPFDLLSEGKFRHRQYVQIGTQRNILVSGLQWSGRLKPFLPVFRSKKKKLRGLKIYNRVYKKRQKFVRLSGLFCVDNRLLNLSDKSSVVITERQNS